MIPSLDGCLSANNIVLRGAGLVCDLCGNKSHFIEDMSSGDTVCLGRDGQWSCGKVVQDHKVFQGVEKRNFEDDDKDRHQHGPGMGG